MRPTPRFREFPLQVEQFKGGQSNPTYRLSTPGARYVMRSKPGPVARLLQDVTEFMTLHAGDVLMLGVSAGAPTGQAGEPFAIECDGLGCLHGRLVAETAEAGA